MPTLAEEYRTFTESAGFADLGSRTQIEVAGEDRVKFLNNFCTADITALQPGRGTEAFICNVKGKVLGYVFIFCGEESLLIETAPGQAGVLIPHLDRYIITEDVQLADVSEGWAFLYAGEPQASERLQKLIESPLPPKPLEFLVEEIAGTSLAIGRGGAIGMHGYTICSDDSDVDLVKQALREAGIAECSRELLDVLRIEAGMPEYARDITDDNLPQEVHRDAQAINLQKGCYLGQETVARIDALGHVNRLLVGLKFAGQEIPSDGLELTADGKPVGHVTSAAFSPGLNAPVALAYIRSAHSNAGSRVSTVAGEAEVVELPMKSQA